MAEVNIKAEVEKATAELQQVMGQVQRIDQEIQGLNQKRNTIVQEALELQGAVKRLQSLDSKEEILEGVLSLPQKEG